MKIARAIPLVNTLLPFLVRDVFANPLNLTGGVKVRISFLAQC